MKDRQLELDLKNKDMDDAAVQGAQGKARRRATEKLAAETNTYLALPYFVPSP